MAEENLEQGFNENELADIMDEIEDLEKEFLGDQDDFLTDGVNEEANEDISDKETAIKKTEKSAKVQPPPTPKKNKTLAKPPSARPEPEETENSASDEAESGETEMDLNGGNENQEFEESEVEDTTGSTNDENEGEQINSDDDVEEALAEAFDEGPVSDAEELKTVGVKKTKMQQVIDEVLIEKEENSESRQTTETDSEGTKVKLDLTNATDFELELTFGEEEILLKLDKTQGIVLSLGSGARFIFPHKR